MDEFTNVSLRFPLLWWSALAVLGLCVGSFLNVVIHRVPLALLSDDAASDRPFRLLMPASHCVKCYAAVRWYDNLPLLSWVLLKGRCRCCRQPVSWQYPLVEAISLVVSLTVGLRCGAGVSLAGLLVFSWLLLALSVIDINTFLLPDCLTLTLLWTGLLFNMNGCFAALPDAVTGAALGYVTLRLLSDLGRLILGKVCMGYGDCKMAAALAAWTGWQPLPWLMFLASVTGIVWLIAARLAGKKNVAGPIPFGPSLAVAGWLTLFALNA